MMSIEIAKQAAGQKAATFIQDGMIVGLGTGSTSAYFIQALIEKKLKIQTVASSIRSEEMAKKGGLSVLKINDAPHIDITVDGADEIDSQKRMIKGGGGAHVREKILAVSSRKMVVIIDESKLVSSLGNTKLPVEILQYGALFTQKKIKTLGFQGSWRKDAQGKLWITDNDNWIFDIVFQTPLTHPEQVHANLLSIPGVIDTGFFFNIASEVIIGKADGTVTIF
jgi:ribose 5-phosphate isomerase A